ncbi:OmpA family protein, partial [Alcanivorax sp. 1008]|uniref:OmpA family protein n=1 Tax=Alcanivorax sp. 1008 TaxID=2816853 RepID=UPI001DA5F205
VGLGADYALNDGWALRFMATSFSEDAVAFSINIMKRFNVSDSAKFAIAEKEEISEPEAVEYIEPALDDRIKKEVSEEVISEEVINELAEMDFSNIKFENNSSSIKEGAKQYLDSVVLFLMKNPEVNLSIEAHSDAVGDDAYNLMLSEQRAQSVVKYLVNKGVSESRLASQGHGESKPIATNQTPEGREKNRRVEFIPY